MKKYLIKLVSSVLEIVDGLINLVFSILNIGIRSEFGLSMLVHYEVLRITKEQKERDNERDKQYDEYLRIKQEALNNVKEPPYEDIV